MALAAVRARALGSVETILGSVGYTRHLYMTRQARMEFNAAVDEYEDVLHQEQGRASILR